MVALQRAQEVDDLRLHRPVEGRVLHLVCCRLVHHQQFVNFNECGPISNVEPDRHGFAPVEFKRMVLYLVLHREVCNKRLLLRILAVLRRKHM